jgi:hypothetical protein
MAKRPTKQRLPRAPLPRQTGGAHEDKTKRPWRRRKHKKPDTSSTDTDHG